MVKSVINFHKVRISNMKKWVSLLVLTAICALNTACGVKGALYFPEQTQQHPTEG